MKKKYTALQIAVMAILDHATAFDWSVQGFGMLRLYVRKIGRIHIWDSTLRYPNVSMVHNHSWDLDSEIVFGILHNTRYRDVSVLYPNTPGNFYKQRLVTGYNTQMVSPVVSVNLERNEPEVYIKGQTYTQRAHEIHRTDAVDGTVTVMARNEEENGEADVYWPRDCEWGTAKPRPATPEEVAFVVNRACTLI